MTERQPPAGDQGDTKRETLDEYFRKAVKAMRLCSGFEEDAALRSEVIRLFAQSRRSSFEPSSTEQATGISEKLADGNTPFSLIQFWHDSRRVPVDVQQCLDSWSTLRGAEVHFYLFDDNSAATYIAEHYGPSELDAFRRCGHPAMRSDYFRMAYILAEGGLYVDADDKLQTLGWRQMFHGDSLKLQPLCYDIESASMAATTDANLYDRPNYRRIFYVNNDPMAAPPGHPVLRRAFARSTEMLLSQSDLRDVQAITGPGNLTAAFAAQIVDDLNCSRATDVDLCFDWELIAEPDWTLAYRNDDRNWRLWGSGDVNKKAGDA